MMNLPRRSFFIFVLLLVLAGCGSTPELDGSSDAALRASLEEVRETLPEEDRHRFDDAYATIVLQEIERAIEEANHAGVVQEDANERLRGRLDGMTGEQVIQEGERLQSEMESE